MIPSIADLVSGFKRNWTQLISAGELEQFCHQQGLEWRERILTPVRTIQLFLLQVLHGNTAITHLPHLSEIEFTPSAYCQARARLPLTVLERLLELIIGKLQNEDFARHKWRGHRVFLVDGSSVSMPDEAVLQEEFPQSSSQREGCGFPNAKLMALFNLSSGMVVKLLSKPLRSHDLSHVAELHEYLQPEDILVGDRAYCSFQHFSRLMARGVHLVIRKHHMIISDFTPGRQHQLPEEPEHTGIVRSRWIRAVGKKDQIIEWFRPRSRPTKMTREEYYSLPSSLTIRELHYQILARGYRSREIILFTSLLNEQKYPAKKIAELYGMRWQIETNLNYLKTTLGMDVLRTKSVDNIRKELIVYCIIYNLIRLVMLEAALRLKLPLQRISFIDATRWLLESLFHPHRLILATVPTRPGRREPRTKKRRDKPYPYMIKPRAELRLMVINQEFRA